MEPDKAQTDITALTAPGRYKLQLTVTDNDGETDADIIDIYVTDSKLKTIYEIYTSI